MRAAVADKRKNVITFYFALLVLNGGFFFVAKAILFVGEMKLCGGIEFEAAEKMFMLKIL